MIEAITRATIARVVYEWAIGRGCEYLFDEAPTSIRDRCNHTTDAILSAIEQEGFVVVPKEPTPEMVEAAARYCIDPFFTCAWEAAIQAHHRESIRL